MTTTVPYIFASMTGVVPAADLDADFGALCTAIDAALAAVAAVAPNGNLTAPQQFLMTGVAAPTGVSGTLDDYSPTGWTAACVLRVTTSGATTLDGLSGGVNGRTALIENVGTAPITVVSEAAGSAAANRFTLTTTSTVIPVNGTMLIQYDGSASRWRPITGAATGREVLTAARTYFVATTGNDSNNGLTAGTPFLTVQKAVNVAYGLDFNGQVVTIQIADGTYAGGVLLSGPAVGQTAPAQLIIQGNMVTPANVVFSFATAGSACLTGTNYALATIQGIRFNGTSSTFSISPQSGAVFFISTCDFGAASTHLYALAGGFIGVAGNYTISGGTSSHMRAQQRGMIQLLGGRTITITGSPTFSAFAYADSCSVIISNGCTFTGTVSGPRYTVTLNGVIDTNVSGANYFPGTTAGSVATGGQYN